MFREVAYDFFNGVGSFRTSVGTAMIWSPLASLRVLREVDYLQADTWPERCSSQIFFRFANAAIELGVCPARKGRSSRLSLSCFRALAAACLLFAGIFHFASACRRHRHLLPLLLYHGQLAFSPPAAIFLISSSSASMPARKAAICASARTRLRSISRRFRSSSFSSLRLGHSFSLASCARGPSR